jgi:peptide/nickel transport system permease protein
MSDTITTDLVAESPLSEAWVVFRRSGLALFGLGLLLIIIIVSVVGPFIYNVDPFDIIWAPFTEPGMEAVVPLGTDQLGRDILAGLIYGGNATLLVGISAALITVIIGISIGAMAGFYGGLADNVLMRVTEFFQVLPPLLFAMVLVTLFSPSLPIVAIAIGVVSWPATARLARAEFIRIRNLEYVNAARSIGSKNSRIIWRVILPNALPPLIVSSTLSIGIAILFEAGLSFLGSQCHELGAVDRFRPRIYS